MTVSKEFLVIFQLKSDTVGKAQCYDCEVGDAGWLTASVGVPKENAML
jgi:hypothetical protein